MKSVVDLSGKQILIGAKVILVARRKDKLADVMAILEGKGHKYYCFDLKRVDDIEEFIKGVIAETGPLDGFVHSAGISSTRPLKMIKPSVLREVMEINFVSFVEITRCITKRNCYNPGLSIVGISSISSKLGNQAKTAYCASKAAMDAV